MKVVPDSDICIEGFPRSANSYAVVAFRLANPEVKIAHHLHVPAQLLMAVHKQIPAVFLIREPLEAVASFMVFQSSKNADLYLKAYIRFYKVLKNIQSSLVIVDFATVTQNFNELVRRVNRKFSTHFLELENPEAHEKEIYQKLKRINDQFFAGQQLKSMYPDPMREKLKSDAKVLIKKSAYLEKAKEYYQWFLKHDS